MDRCGTSSAVSVALGCPREDSNLLSLCEAESTYQVFRPNDFNRDLADGPRGARAPRAKRGNRGR